MKMAKISLLLLFGIFLSISFFSCLKTDAVIPALKPPTLGDKKVLIEEFTGVKCVNCPDGSAEIESLLAIYGENLIAVSIHAGSFAVPYQGQDDYSTPEGKEILEYVGIPFGYPTAVIDRKLFKDESFLQLTKGQWAGFIREQAESKLKVNVKLVNSYDAASRNMNATVTVTALENLDNANVTILLTESGIVGKQLTSSGLKTEYEHKHMLRKVLSRPTGDLLADKLLSGTPISKSYSFTLPNGWVPEKCEVIAFVHQNNGTSKEVLQAEQQHLVK